VFEPTSLMQRELTGSTLAARAAAGKGDDGKACQENPQVPSSEGNHASGRLPSSVKMGKEAARPVLPCEGP